MKKINKSNVVMTSICIGFALGWVGLMSFGPNEEPTWANIAGLALLALCTWVGDLAVRKSWIVFSPEDDEA